MAKLDMEVGVRIAWKNRRAIKALSTIVEVLEDIAEDFEYRDDVKKAIRAARYLGKNVTVQMDGADSE